MVKKTETPAQWVRSFLLAGTVAVLAGASGCWCSSPKRQQQQFQPKTPVNNTSSQGPGQGQAQTTGQGQNGLSIQTQSQGWDDRTRSQTAGQVPGGQVPGSGVTQPGAGMVAGPGSAPTYVVPGSGAGGFQNPNLTKPDPVPPGAPLQGPTSRYQGLLQSEPRQGQELAVIGTTGQQPVDGSGTPKIEAPMPPPPPSMALRAPSLPGDAGVIATSGGGQPVGIATAPEGQAGLPPFTNNPLQGGGDPAQMPVPPQSAPLQLIAPPAPQAPQPILPGVQ
jgi:hypothetical protein